MLESAVYLIMADKMHLSGTDQATACGTALDVRVTVCKTCLRIAKKQTT